jgi:hypothetical protein
MPVKRTTHSNTGGAGGGGINSRATARLTTYHVGYRGDRVSEAATSQLGSQMGNKATDHSQKLPNPASPLYSGPLNRPGQPPLGSEVAVSTVCKPGGSREVMKTGSQNQWGPAAGSPKPQGRPILQDYGPDYKGSGRG